MELWMRLVRTLEVQGPWHCCTHQTVLVVDLLLTPVACFPISQVEPCRFRLCDSEGMFVPPCRSPCGKNDRHACSKGDFDPYKPHDLDASPYSTIYCLRICIMEGSSVWLRSYPAVSCHGFWLCRLWAFFLLQYFSGHLREWPAIGLSSQFLLFFSAMLAMFIEPRDEITEARR